MSKTSARASARCFKMRCMPEISSTLCNFGNVVIFRNHEECVRLVDGGGGKTKTAIYFQAMSARTCRAGVCGPVTSGGYRPRDWPAGFGRAPAFQRKYEWTNSQHLLPPCPPQTLWRKLKLEMYGKSPDLGDLTIFAKWGHRSRGCGKMIAIVR